MNSELLIYRINRIIIKKPKSLDLGFFYDLNHRISLCSCDICKKKEKIMKSITLIIAAAGLLFACGTTPEDVQETIEETVEIELGENYGPFEVNPKEAVTVAEMLKSFDGKTEETEYTFEGELNEVCSKAGCWVNIDKGDGETFMVRFKDHFTIPPKTDVGTVAYFHGVAYWDTVSVELLQHFAEDAGKSEEEIAKITEPKYELGFEADGIVLRK